MKKLFILSIIICFLSPSLSQTTCTSCRYGYMFPELGNEVQFRDTETDADQAVANTASALGSNSATLATAQEACDANACGDNSTCTNLTANYFECGCQESFYVETRSSDSFACADIDECNNSTLNNCSSLANCTNESPGFNCTCQTGYAGDGVTCQDIDECNDQPCHENATCTNNNGSYECTCHTGFSGDGFNCTDINECVESQPCHTNANCTNTNGSFECVCWEGYSGNGVNCTEINECTTGIHNCSDNANCTNTNASYTCECHDGYSGDGFNCTEINECATNTDNCSVNANCTNTNGSYTCECRVGYIGDGFNCTDIDECTVNTDDCHNNATCNNTEGSYTCACNEGFSGDGFTCDDINECANDTTNNCSRNANCTNTEGGFECVCETGFTGTGDVCDDINECNITGGNDCHENANCTNTNGSFICQCNPGYSGNGTYCEDIDDCATDPCHANATCNDLVNDYNCTCNPGFQGNGTYCQSINECANETLNDCHANATCAETEGSYTCTCDPGFTGDGVNCTDVDDCASNPCHERANCTDQFNNYTCTCQANYTGDGVNTCERVRVNVTIVFYKTYDGRNYSVDLQNVSSALYIEITSQTGTAITSFVQRTDEGATVDESLIQYNFSTSADGLGFAESRIVVPISNTNIEEDAYLRSVNSIAINDLVSSSSADECSLGISQCGAGDTCWDTPHSYCCFHDLEGRFNITIDETYTTSLENLNDAYTALLTRNITEFMNITFLPRLQKRSCLSRLEKSIDIPFYREGSIVSVLALLLKDATFSLQDITDELNKLAGENTTFGTILRAGDFDECIQDYLLFRNCSAFAICINFAGDFTCECNETRYDNGTQPGEICINPIIVGCGGNILNVSVLMSYYAQKNISLDSLHLADESCNRTTHATENGDTIEFSVNINECNTTLAYSADNTSIIASNYISNLPSTGVFTGVEIVVPFECALPVDLNITLGLNGTVDTVRLPNSQSTGGLDLSFNMFTSSAYTTQQSSTKTYSSTEILYAQISLDNDINGISVKVSRCFGTPTNSRTDPEQFPFITDGCSTGAAAAFNMLSNGEGNARFSFQMFFFRQVNAAYLHCEVQACTPNCQQSCFRRRRKRSTADFTPLVFVTVPIRLDPSDSMFNNMTFPIFGTNQPGSGGNSGNFTNDIALPIISAVLAFVLIVLLALLVLVVVRKRRSSKEEYGVHHVNMHAIGVKPPEY